LDYLGISTKNNSNYKEVTYKEEVKQESIIAWNDSKRFI